MKAIRPVITVRALLEEKKEDFRLKLIAGERGLDRRIGIIDINRPGLALAGFTENFLRERVQIVGRTELSYLRTLSRAEVEAAIQRVCSFQPPCFIVSKALRVPQPWLDAANRCAIPILLTSYSTTPFIHRLTSYLDVKLAPVVFMHGTLVDVYGVGMLVTGEAGIGKSECALDLVERGHRLVADDLVRVTRRANQILIGSGAEKSRLLQHHMEIRGVGIVDIYSIFGIRSVRLRKRVEVEVDLVRWTKRLDYERLGIRRRDTRILGVPIPLVRVPVVPGKNISVILEVIAMNQLLRLRGYSPAEAYNRELIRVMRATQPETPLVDDFE